MRPKHNVLRCFSVDRQEKRTVTRASTILKIPREEEVCRFEPVFSVLCQKKEEKNLEGKWTKDEDGNRQRVKFGTDAPVSLRCTASKLAAKAAPIEAAVRHCLLDRRLLHATQLSRPVDNTDSVCTRQTLAFSFSCPWPARAQSRVRVRVCSGRFHNPPSPCCPRNRKGAKGLYSRKKKVATRGSRTSGTNSQQKSPTTRTRCRAYGARHSKMRACDWSTTSPSRKKASKG